MIHGIKSKVDFFDMAVRDIAVIKNKTANLDELGRDVRVCMEKLGKLSDKLEAVERTTVELRDSQETLAGRVERIECQPAIACDCSAEQRGRLVARVQRLEAAENSCRLIISGLPESEVADRLMAYNCVKLVCNSIDIVDIIDAYRMRRQNNSERPRTLVIKCLSSNIRSKILSGKKLKGLVKANEIDPSFPANNVYMNEFLPSETYKLLAAAKSAARSANFEYVWCRNDIVRAKKSNSSETLYIKSFLI